MTLSDFQFENPLFAWTALGVAAYTAFLAWRRRHRREPGFKVSSDELWTALPTTFFSRFYWLPDGLRILSLLMFVVALARPQALGEPTSFDSDGIDIVVALDISGSMQARDFQPDDRMAVAKRAVARFIEARPSDRLGLVVFAGEAASWVPLTVDHSVLLQMLDEVQVGMLPDGTAIGSALGNALNRLRASDAKSRVVVLLTDGDNNAGNISPNKAAELAKDLGIKVFTILIGQGGLVPFPAGKDLFGRTVYRQRKLPINPGLMKEIAEMTGGDAYRAESANELDARLSDVLDTLERSQREETAPFRQKNELYAPVLAAGLMLLVLESLLRATRFWSLP
jgi:Ca-activated chloride channel homolog